MEFKEFSYNQAAADEMVDIGTEWNLKICAYLLMVRQSEVDIGTEWNLKTEKQFIPDETLL